MSKSVRAPTDPVLTQPGLGTTTTTITTITQTGGDWSSSLFDACGDKTTCTGQYYNYIHTLIALNDQPHTKNPALAHAGILGALVPCCLDLSLAHQFGECLCLPLLPGSTFAMRVGIRERYKIQVSGAKTSESRGSCCYSPLDGVMSVSQQGSLCEDWTTVYCCYPLAVCQMIREMKRRMKTQTYRVATTLQCSWRCSRRRTRRLLRKASWDVKPVLQHWERGRAYSAAFFFSFF